MSEKSVNSASPQQITGLKIFLYQVLFCIPVIGWIFLIVSTFSRKNLNRRAVARSFWWAVLFSALALLLIRVGAQNIRFSPKDIAAALNNLLGSQNRVETEIPEETFTAAPGSEATDAPKAEATEAPAETSAETADAEAGINAQSSKAEIKELQELLIGVGLLNSGSADGVYGKKTTAAIRNFQQYVNDETYDSLNVTGECDAETLKLLREFNEDGKTAVAATEEPTEAPAKATEAPKEEKSASGLTPSFKEMMDEYEAFFDDYIDFMKKYNKNPTDPSLLVDYAKYMADFASYMGKLEKCEDKAMTDEDVAYYTKVNTRILKKLTQAGLG